MTRIILLTALSALLVATPSCSAFSFSHFPSKNKPLQNSLKKMRLTKKRKWYEKKYCFPANAQMQLKNNTTIPISSLRVGDIVQTGQGKTSRVFMFTHAMNEGIYEFVSLQTQHGNLTLSAGHLVLINSHTTAAHSVRPGDSLTTIEGKQTVVNRVSHVTGRGLYHPQTLDGRVVVDGFIATTYTEHVPISVASPLLSPFRALFSMFGLDMTGGAFEQNTTLRSVLLRAVGGK